MAGQPLDQDINSERMPDVSLCSSRTGGPLHAGETRLRALHDQAKQGFALAQFELGVCYANGDGVKVDKTEGAQLYGQATEQGHGQAQYNLASCYANGQGVKLDKAKAAQLWGQAAEQGHAGAQYTLCTWYANGEGVKLDKAKSGSFILDALPRGLGKLLNESLSSNGTPDTPFAAARAHIQIAVYSLNIAARQGDATADEQLKLLADRRDAVSACGVGCGAPAEDVRQVPHRALLRQGVHRAHVARAQGVLQGVAHQIRGRRRAELGG
jgi:TPR repeat protein